MCGDSVATKWSFCVKSDELSKLMQRSIPVSEDRIHCLTHSENPRHSKSPLVSS